MDPEDEITPSAASEVRARPKVKLRERRYFEAEDLEIRADGDRPPEIHGHAIRYGIWSQDLGGFRERIMAGAARKTIGEADIRALVNHDPNFVLGRNRSSTLELSEDDRGVHNRILPPDTTWASDLLVSMRRGDINQQSFGFRAIRDEWRTPDQATKKDGLWERDVHELQLFDVSIVTFPGFTQTSAHVRSELGELEGVGIDWSALTALLTRAERGISITDTDVDLLHGSIDVLRSYLPAEPEPESPGHHSDVPPAGRSGAHLKRELELEALSLLTA